MRTYKPKTEQDRVTRREKRRVDLESLSKSTDEAVRLGALSKLEAMYEADLKREARATKAVEKAKAEETPTPTAEQEAAQEAAATALLAELASWDKPEVDSAKA